MQIVLSCFCCLVCFDREKVVRFIIFISARSVGCHSLYDKERWQCGGLFDVPVEQGWFVGKKSSIAEVPLNLT